MDEKMKFLAKIFGTKTEVVKYIETNLRTNALLLSICMKNEVKDVRNVRGSCIK